MLEMLEKEWVFGLLFSLVVGAIVTWIFLRVLRYRLGLPHKKPGSISIPPWLTGTVERLFFTVLIGLEMPGIPATMIGWLALKLATNWNHPDWKDDPKRRMYAFSALLAGLVSMLFATLGGLICRGELRF